MTDSTQPQSKAFDIYMSGYLLTLDMITYLCLHAYGATKSIVKDMGPLDTACYYFNLRSVIDAPTLIYMPYKDKAQGDKLVDRWLLPGKVVFFQPGTTPPPLSFDEETRAYLSTWLPRDLLLKDAFKDLRFVKRLWPRGERPTGIVLHSIRMLNDKYREKFHKSQQAWIDLGKSRGIVDRKLPPAFPVVWAI
ncbi:hypothetical protein K466DRAFT_664790 [Polyporus arcularius HHB13444]|uniref:Uncharacterized protein n=1 Tax=Polyporus arcularius HHB13444 TaxID=1314778 RepID=A0A5C3P9W7_9APHY|nr:hypothetical protein K466DRAFT_664790 [Polyporus arcularius HHB13444]